VFFFFFSSRRRHTRSKRDWSSDVCSSDLGQYAYIGGVAKVTKDVPPYVLADGVPVTARGVNVIGLRRGGMAPSDRRVLQDAFRILYRSALAPPRAVERIRAELPATEPVKVLLDFIAASKRGICGAGAE